METEQLEQEDKCFLCKKKPYILDFQCKECHNMTQNEIKNEVHIKIDDQELDQIIDGKLYIGNEQASQSLNLLQKLNITAIIVAGSWLQEVFPDNFKYITIEIHDNFDKKIRPFFEQIFEFIDNNDRVFIHCAQGKSRSGTLVIAYLMRKNNWTYHESYIYVKKRRYIVEPNWLFNKELIEYEKELKLNERESK